MRRSTLKRSLAISAIAIAALGVSAWLVFAGLLHHSVTDGAHSSDAFHEPTDASTTITGSLEWRADGARQHRPMEPATRRAVAAAWTRSWQALQLAETGEESVLADWFAGPALDQIQVIASASSDGPIRLDVRSHSLRLVFYSDDGAVVGLDAGPIEVVRTTPAGHSVATSEYFDVVVVLDDGNWRIRQWLRTRVQAGPPAAR